MTVHGLSPFLHKAGMLAGLGTGWGIFSCCNSTWMTQSTLMVLMDTAIWEGRMCICQGTYATKCPLRYSMVCVWLTCMHGIPV